MSLFHIIVLLTVLVAVSSVINYHLLRMPTSIGIMLVSLVVSLTAVVLDALGVSVLHANVLKAVHSVNFYETLMFGMLGALLFAGALQVDLNDFFEKRLEIIVFSTIGVFVSTAMVGTGLYYALMCMGMHVPFIWCLVFGALISPTDPVAVLSILKDVKAPKTFSVTVGGESLFNDGVGVVVFTVILGIATSGHAFSMVDASVLFFREAVGGVLFGLFIGYAGFWVLRGIDNYEVEILVTLAMVLGGYALSLLLHVSGPLAMVAAGLLIGNHGKKYAMSEKTREHLSMFWGFLEEVLNAALFALMGLEMIVLTLRGDYIAASVMAIVVVLLGRFFSVWLPLRGMEFWGRTFPPGATPIMTWGGLRGGICIALALSLPQEGPHDLLVTMTYVVVAFSVIVQGLTMKRLVQQYNT